MNNYLKFKKDLKERKYNPPNNHISSGYKNLLFLFYHDHDISKCVGKIRGKIFQMWNNICLKVSLNFPTEMNFLLSIVVRFLLMFVLFSYIFEVY